MISVFIGLWLLCGVAAFGLTFAYFQGKDPHIAKEQKDLDYMFAAFMGALGPFGLAVAVCGCGFKHSWRFR